MRPAGNPTSDIGHPRSGPRPFRALLRHRAAAAGAGLLLLLGGFVATAGWWVPHDPRVSDPDPQTRRFEGISPRHPLGTDHLKRDVLARVGHGGRPSLLIGFAAVFLSLAAGIPLGAAAGYAGGRTDEAIARILDFMLSFPALLLAIGIAAALGPGRATVILAVGVVGIPQFARLTRASFLSLMQREFVAASRALGAGPLRTVFRGLLPNAAGPLIVLATLGIGEAILSAAGLSYLGFGAGTGEPEWGWMLRDALNHWRRAPMAAIGAGAALSMTVLAFNLLGDGLRDALDPAATVEKAAARGRGPSPERG